MNSTKPKLLFLCTGNSCRSQMAEGFAKKMIGNQFQIFSAGVEAHGLNPKAIEVMREVGIEISNQRSKTIDEVPWKQMDIIITLCGHAAETCPVIPTKATHFHWGLDDPAKATGSDEEIMRIFRKVRDEIKAKIAKVQF